MMDILSVMLRLQVTPVLPPWKLDWDLTPFRTTAKAFNLLLEHPWPLKGLNHSQTRNISIIS
jgi:hypothetical protein